MRLYAKILPLLFLFTAQGERGAIRSEAHPVTPRVELRILWYNVENLFHPDDDTLSGDDEFTPGGVRHWTTARYRKKLTAIAKVIIAAGEGAPPDLVGLCEVEEARILEELVQHPILASYGYRFVHSDSPDPRGMDVACLYRENRIRLSAWKAYPSVTSLKRGGTRDMIHFCGVWGGQDTLDLFLVHLISKYSGAGATAESRKRQAVHLVHLVDSVHRHRESSLKVMVGDFNEPIGGYSMEPVRMGRVGQDSIRQIFLSGSLGSYKYRGEWSRIDQFLVCGQMKPYRFTGSVFEHPILLTRDETYGGIKPNRTYVGYLYNGGISDHLPILLAINGRPFLFHAEQ